MFSTSQFSFSPSLSLSAFFPPSCLTGCHHIFSQLPTTSYSATTDLNTDLASSVPLRRERERYPQPPPAMLQGENFACLISLPAARVHLVISSRFLHILPFSWSAARLENTVLVSKNVSSTFILPIYLFSYFQRVFGRRRSLNAVRKASVWGQSCLLIDFSCVIIQLCVLNEEFLVSNVLLKRHTRAFSIHHWGLCDSSLCVFVCVQINLGCKMVVYP